VLTATYRPTDAPRFALLAVATSLGIFGLLRLNWTEAHLVLPATRMQAAVAVSMFGVPGLPVEATLACSGADALALCVGAILAYPVAWKARLAGAGTGAALILSLNTWRIGTLGQVAGSPAWFTTLHLYVWPAALTLAIAGYVLLWMHIADRLQRVGADSGVGRDSFSTARLKPSGLFIGLLVGLVLLFTLASPLYLESAVIRSLAGAIASAAAGILRALGVDAHAAANVLSTPGGAFLVTQECIVTPLIPVYLATVGAYSPTWRRLILGVAATLPLFTALGILRLLVVGLPEAVSPVFFVHAFYQLLLGAVIVFLTALWRRGHKAAIGYTLAGITGGIVFACLLGPAYALAYESQLGGAPFADPQGALALTPAFQAGLFAAMSIAGFMPVDWRRFVAGFAVLVIAQAAGWLALHALASQWDLTAHVRDIRAWAVAGPVFIFAMATNVARTRR
jgi:exosortase/archaeosortase family protein